MESMTKKTKKSYMSKKFFPPIALIVFAGFTATSCIDENYDLSDIDLTLGVQGDVSLPFCSTGDIILRNIMNLEEDGVVQFIDDPAGGDRIFTVRQSGSTDIPSIHIDEIRFKSPTIKPIETSIELDVDEYASSRPKRISVVLPDGSGQKTYDVELKDHSYAYPIRNNDQTSFLFEDIQAKGISKDLVALEEIGLKPNTITIEIKKVDFGEADFFYGIHLDNSTLSFPKDLHLKSANLRYNGKDHALVIDTDNSVIPFFSGKGELINFLSPVILELVVDGATIGENFTFTTGPDGGEIVMNGEFRLDATLRVETKDVDEEVLQAKVDEMDADLLLSMLDPQSQAIMLDLRDAGFIPDEVTVKGEGEFAEDLVVASVTGTVRREVEDPDPIKLDDLPDFLDDPEVVLDLENPAIFLNVNSDLPGTATTALKLVADVERQTGEISVKQGANLFELSDHRSNLFPKGYENATWLQVADLAALVHRLPEKIGVDIQPVTLKAEHLTIPGSYDITLDYEIFAPVVCGKDFQLVYQDTERGWSSDLEDLEDVDAGFIEIHALADNALPASITLQVTPIDESGHEVKALEPIYLELKANAADQSLEMAVKPREGYTLNDVINGKNGAQRLDGVRYRAVINDPVDEAILRETAKIRLHHIKATLKGGVVIDAN